MIDFAEHLSRQHFARMHYRHIPAVSNSLTNKMSTLYERTTVKDIRTIELAGPTTPQQEHAIDSAMHWFKKQSNRRQVRNMVVQTNCNRLVHPCKNKTTSITTSSDNRLDRILSALFSKRLHWNSLFPLTSLFLTASITALVAGCSIQKQVQEIDNTGGEIRGSVRQTQDPLSASPQINVVVAIDPELISQLFGKVTVPFTPTKAQVETAMQQVNSITYETMIQKLEKTLQACQEDIERCRVKQR